jgi:hypothetical protein
MAHVTARYWLSVDGSIPRDAASRLLGQLAWRGIGGFPKADQAKTARAESTADGRG